MGGGFTPWALCIGTFIIYPLLAFVIGFYVGRKGMPFSIQVQRKENWGKNQDLADDGYGLAAQDS